MFGGFYYTKAVLTESVYMFCNVWLKQDEISLSIEYSFLLSITSLLI